jgi:hypothetical protein
MVTASEAIARTVSQRDSPKEMIDDDLKNIPFGKPCLYDREHAERWSSNQFHRRTLQRLWKGGDLHRQTMGDQ